MNCSGGGAWWGDKVLCLKCISKLSPGLVGMSPEANHSPRFLPSHKYSQMRSIGPGRMRTNCTVCSSGRVAKLSIPSPLEGIELDAIQFRIAGHDLGAVREFAFQSRSDHVE